MAGKDYSKTKIINAIKESGGIVSVIAERLGCTWDTARRYVDMYPETVAAYLMEKEGILDMAESQIITNINAGNMDAVKYYLGKKGKERGYGDRIEISGSLEHTILNDKEKERLEAEYGLIKARPLPKGKVSDTVDSNSAS